MSFTFYTSNKLDTLLEQLHRNIKAKPLGVFDRETIVVQNLGMGRWLSLQLADRFGVWAGCDYPFPGKFVYQQFCQVFPELTNEELLAEPLLRWKILQALPGLKDAPGFEPVDDYLAVDPEGLKAFQLTEKLASIFDDYQIYGADMLLRWQAEKDVSGHADEKWQRLLWREIVKGKEALHRAALKNKFVRDIGTLGKCVDKRVSVFGISYLASFHLDILKALGQWADVAVYSLAPCKLYWADFASRKKAATLENRAHKSADELKIDIGNPLLTSLGVAGQVFHAQMWDMSETGQEINSDFTDPGSDTLLQALQQDILEARDRSHPAEDKITLADNDDSLQIHSCHSPLREIEVLHDCLLHLLNNNPKLEPRNILVMAPNMETYAPFVRTVFERGVRLPDNNMLRLPVSIADRPAGADNAAAGVLQTLLALKDSRFSAPEIMGLLETAPVRLKFEFSDDHCIVIRKWLHDTAVRWGVNAGHRAKLLGIDEKEATLENSWEHGFQRLFLGYAMPPMETLGPQGILPYPNIEGQAAQLLGRLKQFFTLVTGFADSLSTDRTLEEWHAHISEYAENLMKQAPAEGSDVAGLLAQIRKVADHSKKAGFDRRLSVRVFSALMQSEFQRPSGGGGFLQGGITFCSLQPMRSVPFEVICLLGMNEGDFPRREDSPKFNRVAGRGRGVTAGVPPRDRVLTVGEEDRYLFLETLLSARKKLIISYVGKSIKDNTAQMPSLCVSELIDYLGASITAPGQTPMKFEDRLVVHHRLHAFSPRYFSDHKKLFSYSGQLREVSSGLEKKTALLPFVSRPIAPENDNWKNISVEDFVRFFVNPSRYFFQNRLGIYFPEAEDDLKDKEAFEFDGLERYVTLQKFLEARLQNHPANPEQERLIRAEGVLPHGVLGKYCFAHSVKLGDSMIREAEKSVKTCPLRVSEQGVDITRNGFRISGSLSCHAMGDGRRGVMDCRPANLKGKHLLPIWIRHVLWCAQAPEQAGPALLVLKDDVLKFMPVADAMAVLDSWLELYGKGNCAPLPFYLNAAVSFMELNKFKIKREPLSPEPVRLQFAEDAFFGSEQNDEGGECDLDDAYVALAVRHLDAVSKSPVDDKAFKEAAEKVFRGMKEVYFNALEADLALADAEKKKREAEKLAKPARKKNNDKPE